MYAQSESMFSGTKGPISPIVIVVIRDTSCSYDDYLANWTALKAQCFARSTAREAAPMSFRTSAALYAYAIAAWAALGREAVYHLVSLKLAGFTILTS